MDAFQAKTGIDEVEYLQESSVREGCAGAEWKIPHRYIELFQKRVWGMDPKRPQNEYFFSLLFANNTHTRAAEKTTKQKHKAYDENWCVCTEASQ